jgi:pimeloyl-ACP methyl ester carboxylesterase
MPGFLAGDQTLGVMAGWLWRLGYRPHTCGFVANVDCSDRAAARVEQKVRSLHASTGRRVALLGHSRGGHFARAVARRAPQHVSHAISLGADLNAMFGTSTPTLYAVSATRRLVRVTGRAGSERCLTVDCDCPFTRDYAGAFPDDRVHLTSIYSRGDGVVRWESCLVPYGNCVHVGGSHVGLIFNRRSYRAIARALAEPELASEVP